MKKKKKIIIGTRGSKLALIYAKKAKNEIKKFKNKFNIDQIEIQKIKTQGDVIKNIRLSETGGKGLFSKKIEEKLFKKKIDIAVHALKDMPTTQTDGLVTKFYLKRNDPREALISKNKKKLSKLKEGSIVGTSSFRREFQLKRKHKKLKFKLIRGNVDTRIKKIKNGLYDAIILSSTGLRALGLKKNISQTFKTSQIIPSAGQGTIALQCRKNDKYILNLLKNVNHLPTKICVEAERDVLKILDGDCYTAVGVYAKIVNSNICMEAELFSLDGKKRYYLKSSQHKKFSKILGKKIGKILKKKSNNSHKK